MAGCRQNYSDEKNLPVIDEFTHDNIFISCYTFIQQCLPRSAGARQRLRHR